MEGKEIIDLTDNNNIIEHMNKNSIPVLMITTTKKKTISLKLSTKLLRCLRVMSLNRGKQQEVIIIREEPDKEKGVQGEAIGIQGISKVQNKIIIDTITKDKV